MKSQLISNSIDLLEPFRRPNGDYPELIGTEVECALVHPGTGDAIGYHGSAGVCALLEAILKRSGGHPLNDGDFLVGVSLDDGARISLEPGGAIEYASAPSLSVDELAVTAMAGIEAIADVSHELGIALLPGGIFPFTSMRDIPWVPKRRVQVMRDYFGRLGAKGMLADGVMGLTLSTQATLDYTSEDDLAAKVGMLVAATPVIAALFVNSPIEAGKPTGALSRRMQLWRRIDPSRCGIMPFVNGCNTRVRDLIEWVTSLPMIYRSVAGVHAAAPQAPFGEILRDGFGDGRPVTQEDWESQLSQVWPDVRVRRTIELRVTDGPPWPAFSAVPAVWTGLAYHPPSLESAWQLLGDMSVTEIDAARDDVCIRGLDARLGRYQVRDLARELVRLASAGLEARADAGLEPPKVVRLLDPVADIVESGETFAAQCLSRWHGEFGENPAKYVSAYQL